MHVSIVSFCSYLTHCVHAYVRMCLSVHMYVCLHTLLHGALRSVHCHTDLDTAQTAGSDFATSLVHLWFCQAVLVVSYELSPLALYLCTDL